MILVSKSPRRQKILKDAGFNFRTVESKVSESYPDNLSVEEVPVYLAEMKARSISEQFPEEILIGCDTIVVIDYEILGKPSDKADAVKLLKRISGKEHKVISGVCMLSNSNTIKFIDESLVKFRELTINEIGYYIDNYQPFDKAGAYGIQEWIGMTGIEYIKGSFYNVMGLPIFKIYSELQKLGVSVI